MQEKEKVQIDELVDICSEFINHPDNKEKIEAFNQLKESLIIRPRLSLQEKEILLMTIIYDLQTYDDEGVSIASAVETSLFFNGLLGYTNINIQSNVVYKNIISYDIIFTSGLTDYILDFCERDYNRLKELVHQAISWQNIKNLLETINTMSPESVDKLTQEFQNFTFKADTETIRNLAEIARFQDPLYTKVKDEILEGTYKVVEATQKN